MDAQRSVAALMELLSGRYRVLSGCYLTVADDFDALAADADNGGRGFRRLRLSQQLLTSRAARDHITVHYRRCQRRYGQTCAASQRLRCAANFGRCITSSEPRDTQLNRTQR